MRALALGSASAIALTLFASGASAQENTQGAATVDEIVVTANKREESVQSIPAAVTAIGGAALQQQGIGNVPDLQMRVPSLVAGSGPFVTAVSLRGVGTNNLSAASQPGVAIHIDGVYQPRLSAGALGALDLERVEVLRGPQGTLYGRNASGGVINYVTAAPGGELSGAVTAGYASYDEVRLGGFLNVPLGDRIRGRLAVDYTDRSDGFVENARAGGPDADKGSTLSSRLKIAADLTDTVTAELSAYYLNREGGFPYIQLDGPPNAAAVAGNPFLAGAVVPLRPHTMTSDLAPSSDLDTYGATLTISADLGFATLKSISAYSWYRYVDHFDADATNLAFTEQTDGHKSKTLSQEINLTGATSRLNWLVGAFYLDDSLQMDTQFDFPLGFPASGLAPDGRLSIQSRPYDTTTIAVFTDNSFALNDRLRLIAGARYTTDKVDVTQLVTLNRVQTPVGVLPSLTVCNNFQNDLTFDSATGRGGLQYDIAEGAMSYMTVSTGYKAGGVNPSACGNTYRPEKVTAYEGGLRLKLLDGRLALNPTVFYYDYQDFQVSQLVGLSQLLMNAPEATVKGFEIESVFAATPQLTVNANLTLLDSTYGDGFQNTDPLNIAAGAQDLEGRRLNRSPKVSGSLGVQYRTDLSGLGRLTARADVYASSRIYFREFNSKADSQSPYATLNLNLIWDSPNGRYSARLYAKNATDTDYLGALASADSFGARFINYAPPRQVGAELTARF